MRKLWLLLLLPIVVLGVWLTVTNADPSRPEKATLALEERSFREYLEDNAAGMVATIEFDGQWVIVTRRDSGTYRVHMPGAEETLDLLGINPYPTIRRYFGHEYVFYAALAAVAIGILVLVISRQKVNPAHDANIEPKP